MNNRKESSHHVSFFLSVYASHSCSHFDHWVQDLFSTRMRLFPCVLVCYPDTVQIMWKGLACCMVQANSKHASSISLCVSIFTHFLVNVYSMKKYLNIAPPPGWAWTLFSKEAMSGELLAFIPQTMVTLILDIRTQASQLLQSNLVWIRVHRHSFQN